MSQPKEHASTRNRFEFEEGGATAWLEFEVDSTGWMTLWHTEVPEALRGRGIAGVLAKNAFDYALEHKLKVDVVCPAAASYAAKHPEYKPLIGK